jgi:hypothetical protein
MNLELLSKLLTQLKLLGDAVPENIQQLVAQLEEDDRRRHFHVEVYAENDWFE